jgi:hypothetical protein
VNARWERLKAWHRGTPVPPEADPASGGIRLAPEHHRPRAAILLDHLALFWLNNWKAILIAAGLIAVGFLAKHL